MLKHFVVVIVMLTSVPALLFSQTEADDNSAQKLLEKENRVSFGMYGQIDYNQPLSDGLRRNGKMDIHRLVGFIGYNFSDKVSFVSEIEIEHVVEVYVEQAFLNYGWKDALSFRAGLLLIPMGIINEYHEPTTYNGVERPNLHSAIVPTTWREMGAGIYGKFNAAALKYQLYVVNGFKSFDGTGKLSGSSALRGGRQKAAESIISTPDLSGKIDYYGINGLRIGLAGYLGETESVLFDGLDPNNTAMVSRADSSVVGVKMVGLDARYNYKAFEARGELIYADLDGAGAYNQFTGKDLGSSMAGYYLEAGFDVLSLTNCEDRLVAFGRYEKYYTHYEVPEGTTLNQMYNRTDYTFGLNWYVNDHVVVKGDYQIFDNEDPNTIAQNQVNFGLGFWFY